MYPLQGNPNTWTYSPQSTNPLQGSTNTGGSPSPQTSSQTPLQGSSPNLQPTANPNNYIDPVAAGNTLGASTSVVDPAIAAKAAQAGQLRSQITSLVENIKNIFNARYGQVDQSGSEQTSKLSDRYATETGDIATQVGEENARLGAGAAAGGTFDSSYRGNNMDTITREGSNQVRDLGTELQDNLAKIASWVSQQKSGYDAQKSGLDAVLAHLAEATDPEELASLRNTLEGRISELRSSSTDNNTAAQNAGALSTIAPSNARAVKLKTTLSQILSGAAAPAQKATIGQRIIQSAGIDPEEAQKLLVAFQSDLQSTPEQQKQTQA